jgi:hypothetical protein
MSHPQYFVLVEPGSPPLEAVLAFRRKDPKLAVDGFLARTSDVVPDPAPLFERMRDGQTVLASGARVLLSSLFIHRACVDDRLIREVSREVWQHEHAASDA